MAGLLPEYPLLQQNFTVYCGAWVRINLDTGYDLLRSIQHLSLTEQSIITLVYSPKNDIRIRASANLLVYVSDWQRRTDDSNILVRISTGYLCRNTPTQHWQIFHINGRLIADTYFDKGKKVGHWRLWNENGKIFRDMNFENNELNGHYRIWRYNGTLIEDGYFRNGKRTGHWCWWTDNGEPDTVGDYEDDKRIGYWKEHELLAIMHAREEGYYERGMRNGLWKRIYDNGTVEEIHYVDDIPDGSEDEQGV